MSNCRIAVDEKSGSTSSSLLRAIAQMDRDGWSRFVRLYAPLVYDWSRRVGLQESDADDVIQDVFRAVAASIQSFRRDSGNTLSAWLWGITRNKLRDFFRKAAKLPALLGELQPFDDAERFLSAEPDDAQNGRLLAARAMQIMQADFEPHVWAAFWQFAVDGRRAAEVAQELGMTVGAVRQAKFRVLSRLRSELDGELGGDGTSS